VAPGTYSVKAGTASIIGLDNYTCGDIIAPYESQAANSTASTLQSDGWSQTNLVDPPLMASSQFTADMAVNGLFYFGHGNTGVVAFPGVCGSNLGDPPYSSPYYWGVGDISGIGNAKAVGSLPNPSNLYWMFLFSSDTVAPEAVEDPADANSGVLTTMQYVANPWEPLFYQTSLPLRGLYGYWQSPGSCDDGVSLGGGTRNCDAYANNSPGVAAALLFAFDTGGVTTTTIPDAWQQSNESNNESGAWSEQLDTNATMDFFGSTYAIGRSGGLQFFDSQTGGPSGSIVQVSPTRGTLAPVNMVNESLNVGGAVATGDSDFSAGALSYTHSDNNLITTFTSVGGLSVNYYTGLSGGVTYSSETLHNPMNVSLSTAQTAAVSFIDNSFGMPSDAVLVDTISFYTLQNSGSSILTGYEFIWNHSGGTIYGGDAIKVDVEDNRHATTICTEMTYPDPPLKPICIAHETTYSDYPNVSYGYRLWRSTGSAVSETRTDYIAGQSTVDAYTASLALPVPSDVTGYHLGYWVTPLAQPTGIAEPAWIYNTVGGRIYAVDAGSGALLGSESQ
jgi:hypothetical protein